MPRSISLPRANKELDNLIKDLSRTMDRLTRDNNKKTNQRAKLATVKTIKYKKKVPNIFTYLVKGNMQNSSKSGYIVNVLIDREHIRKNAQLTKQPVRVSCTCPAYLYWGSKYNATKGGYNLGKGEKRKPKKRDPDGHNKICKHIVAVREVLKSEKIKAELNEIVWKAPEVQESLNSLSLRENIKIPENETEFSELMITLLNQ